MWVRLLEVALHLAILGGLVDVAYLLHHGRTHEAVIHAFIAGICVVILAGAWTLARKLLVKD